MWDKREVGTYAPTVVLDCAFLTPDRAADMPLGEYIAANRTLTERMVYASPARGTSCAQGRGMAVHPHDALDALPEDNPQGYLQREAEHHLVEAAAESGAVPVVVWAARPRALLECLPEQDGHGHRRLAGVGRAGSASRPAQAIILVSTTVLSYFGHRDFSFRRGRADTQDETSRR